MGTFAVEAIILNTINFGEANRVLILFSKEFGKLEVNAYGCRNSRSPLSGVTQMFNHISAEIKRGTRIDTLQEAEIINFYSSLTNDLERLAYASFICEIINRMTLPKQPDIKVFELLRNILKTLAIRNPKVAALIGICQFMETSGMQLNFTQCIRCEKIINGDAVISLNDGGAICNNCLESFTNYQSYPKILRKTFEAMLNFDWDENTKLFFNSKQLEVAFRIFLDYIHSILGCSLKSENFMRQIETLKF